ncbi:MAG: sulfatase [Elusimicrobia bacterium]|nr:sulfatase [Elusimicrobiota bacterium]
MARSRGSSSAGGGSARPPNIVLILIDDLGWRDLGCYGSSFYETPVLDRLASEGALFTDAYASAPVCSPTRASILTGKYPARIGLTQYIGGHGVGRLLDVPYFGWLPTNETSIARALKRGGYRTWHVGKWHLGPRRTWPDQHGFDVNIGGCDWGHPLKGYFSPYGIPTLADGPRGEYLTHRLTDEAIALVEGADDRPFFLELWHYAVHIPIQSPTALVEKYRAKAAAMGLDRTSPFELGEAFPVWHQRDARIQRRVIQSDPDYAAMVEDLDSEIGRFLAALARLDRADDTIVVFTSDNGGLATAEGSPTCNAPLAEGKGWTEEGGIRVPLLVRWPAAVRPGTIVAEPVTSPDLYPTLLAAAGLPPLPQQHVDGVDFGPLLRGEAQVRGPIFWHYPHYSNQGGRPSAAVRDGSRKLIHWFEDGRSGLYDIERDPGESQDLAASEPDEVRRLEALLFEWLREVGGRVPERNPEPDPHPGLAGYFLGGQIASPPPEIRART